jgi:hypothetical protein
MGDSAMPRLPPLPGIRVNLRLQALMDMDIDSDLGCCIVRVLIQHYSLKLTMRLHDDSPERTRHQSPGWSEAQPREIRKQHKVL